MEKFQAPTHLTVIAHDIRSLHNVGSIFRSCDAFGVGRLYLTGITGVPPRKEIAKVALGSERRVLWEHREDLMALCEELRLLGFKILALETGHGSIPIHMIDREDSVAIILGNEVTGLDGTILSLVDLIVEIPMRGVKKSLNVSVVAGIALFALTQKKR